MDFDISRILRILPHRAPFVLIDRVTELSPRKSAKAIKCVSYNEPFFQGHFPGNPVLPAVLVVEAMAQLTGVLAYASEPFDTNMKVMSFLGIDHAKFRKPVIPGDVLEVEVEVTQRRANIWKMAGTAMVGDVLVAQAELLAAIQDREESAGR
jgi:3-hydroxyacyl-[acyl-carrier-protein] dehydratase